LSSKLAITEQKLYLEATSQNQIKNGLDVNLYNPFEVDLSNVFFKQTTEVSTKEVSLSEVNNQPLLINDIAWLAETNQPLDREWRRAVRSNQEVSLIVIKIDKLAEILTSLGQELGEKCINTLVSTIETVVHRGGDQLLTCKKKDILYLILPETSAEGAMVVAQRIKQALLEIKNFPDNNLLAVSQVIATAKPKRNNKPMILLKKIISNFSKLSTPNQIFVNNE
jgi:diguanylate cyclase (GGDEF)-like protein